MPHAATLQQPKPPPLFSDPQFLSIEVAPATDGSLWVTSTATYADEPNCEFINDQVEHVRAASLGIASKYFLKTSSARCFSLPPLSE